MRTFSTLLALLLAGTSPALAAPAQPDADPALWVAKDADTTVYLFGTFHALDGKSDWFNEEVKQAFDKSDEVVLEIQAPDPATMLPIVAKYAIDKSGKTLSSKLSPVGRERLAKYLGAMGAPATAFDQLKPFFASLSLVMAESQKLGFTGEHGSEAVLTKAAKAAGKNIGNLETIEFQLAMFDRLPEAKQVEMLEQTLAELDQVPAMFTQMQKAWTAGDADGFAKLMHEMDAQSPESYKLMMSDRNATWAEWIDQRMDKPGTVFVAVGTGHLAGKDNVHQLLAARGIKSTRVKTD